MIPAHSALRERCSLLQGYQQLVGKRDTVGPAAITRGIAQCCGTTLAHLRCEKCIGRGVHLKMVDEKKKCFWQVQMLSSGKLELLPVGNEMFWTEREFFQVISAWWNRNSLASQLSILNTSWEMAEQVYFISDKVPTCGADGLEMLLEKSEGGCQCLSLRKVWKNECILWF